MDVASLKRADIIKGPASSLYGSNAIGGVVSFTTKDPADFLNAQGDDFGVSVDTQYTSENEGAHATINLANRFGDVESLILYTHRELNETETQGDIGGEGDLRTEADPMRSSVDNVLAKVQIQLNDAHRIGFTGEYFAKDSQIDVLSKNRVWEFVMGGRQGPMPGSITYADNRTDDALERTRLSVEHNWQADLAAFDRLNWSISAQDTASEHDTFDTITPTGVANFFVRSQGPRVNNYSQEEESVQFSAQFNKTLGSHQLTYGANAETLETTNSTGRIYLEDPSAEVESGRYMVSATS